MLLDQRMPGMDGTEVLRELRKKEEGINANIPVICMTADAIIGAKERYTALGFTDYLSKPANGETLERMLMKYLPAEKIQEGRKQVMPEPETPEDTGEKAGRNAILHKEGIDPGTGLIYCQHDEELYEAMLREYARGADEKTQRMQASYEAKDWKEYAVVVHSVKSSSRLIGAVKLSEKAARLEKAADGDDALYIEKHHDRLMGKYRSAAAAAGKAAGSEEPPETHQEELNDSVFEFYPESNQ